jgi:Helix-turn-helix domain
VARLNPRRAKLHRSYTVEEVARLFGTHRNTVRNWLKAGLKAIDDHRPLMIQGQVLRAFLQARREGAKRPCAAGTLYCCKCRVPRPPAEPTYPRSGLWLLAMAMPKLGNIPVSKMRPLDVLEVLQKVEARGNYETARRLRSTIGSVCRYAIITARAETEPCKFFWLINQLQRSLHRCSTI